MGFLGLFTRHKPKIKVQSTKKDGFSGWVKCSHCTEMVHANEMQDNANCCPKCGHHYRFSAEQRIDLLSDQGTFKELFNDLSPSDPLEFFDKESYIDRIDKAQSKTQRKEGIYTGTCLLEGKKIALGVMDFSFMGGSMGSVVGEKITRLVEYAIDHYLPVVLVCSSGGARMQESCLSLMQMAKTSAALRNLHEKGLPYISILTNPTTGGVTASFAALGDIIIAEPDALIGFAGPRVVEQTIKQKLPPTAQKSEFLLEKGMIDCIASRVELKQKVSFFIDFLTENESLDSDATLAKKKKELPEKLQELIEVAEKKSDDKKKKATKKATS